MRLATTILLLVPLMLLPTQASAQGAATPATGVAWTGRSVALVRVDGRSMAPACPTRKQVDHFVRERSLKWDDASIGCRFLMSGNFSSATVQEVSGDYIRVRFALTSFPSSRSYWTPRRNFRLVS